jgi:hypothetical protein
MEIEVITVGGYEEVGRNMTAVVAVRILSSLIWACALTGS